MKKALLILVIIVAIVGITACDLIHTHSYGEWSVTKKATCAEDGVKTRYCDCGEKQSEVIPASHKEQIIPATEATCTKTGLTEGKKCSDCGETLVVQQEIPMIAHTYDDKYDESCNVCGFIRDAECAHREIEIIKGYEATCTSTGLTEGKHCAICNEVLVSQEITPIVGHNFVGVYCTECGTEKYSEWLNFYLNVDGESYSVGSHGLSDCTDIIIPSKIDGLPVTSIVAWAFENCTALESVIIGDSVTAIPSNAFYGCSALESVIIGNSVEVIGEGAFILCTSLSNIIIPNSVTKIEGGAFGLCRLLTSVTIPNSVRYIYDHAFNGCTSLASIYFDGTIDEWLVTSKSSAWDSSTGDYTIYCTDGEIVKDGTVTYYPSEGLEFVLSADEKSYSVKGVGTCTDTHIVIPDVYNNLPATSMGATGVIVSFETDLADKDGFKECAKNVALQTAAMEVKYLDKESVPASVIEEEQNILINQMKEDPKMANKPEAVLQNIVKGRLGKFYENNCLLEQAYVKDDSMSVSKYVASVAKELGGSIKVTGYVRYDKGEGIQKREEDFGAEIAKMVNG